VQDIQLEGDAVTHIRALKSTQSYPIQEWDTSWTGLKTHPFLRWEGMHVSKNGNRVAHYILAKHSQYMEDAVAWVEESPNVCRKLL
jgi:hypothetical protein